MKTLSLLLIAFSFYSCGNTQSSENKERYLEQTLQPHVACSDIYPFIEYYIDLDSLKERPSSILPDNDFKKCSIYKRRFLTERFRFKLPSDSVLNDKWCEYVFVNDFKIKITNPDYEVSYVDLPVKWKDGAIYRRPYTITNNDFVIFVYDRYEDDFFRIYKMDYSGIIDSSHVYRDAHDLIKVNKGKEGRMRLQPFYFNENYIVFSTHNWFDEPEMSSIIDLRNFKQRGFYYNLSGVVWSEDEKEIVGLIDVPDHGERKEGDILHFYSFIDDTKMMLEIPWADEASSTLFRNDTLIVANYHPIATGSSLHAFDLKNKKKIWKADALQITTDHSKYYNSVVLSRFGNKIIMEGNEAHGDYVQIFDWKTGKRLAEFGAVVKK